MSWRKDVGATTIHAQKLAERATSGGRVRRKKRQIQTGKPTPRFAPAHWGIPVGAGSPYAGVWRVVRVGPWPHARVRRTVSTSA